MTRIEQWVKCPNSGKLVVGPNCFLRAPRCLRDGEHFTGYTERVTGRLWTVIRGRSWTHHVPRGGVLILQWEAEQ